MRKVQINCTQHIPCDPCRYACPQGAIIMEDLTDTPAVNIEKCTGCGICIAVCPGQACTVLDDSFAPGRAALTFPYEYLPMPKKGQSARGVNNSGEIVCEAVVEKVSIADRYDHTSLVTISFEDVFAGGVTGMRKLPARNHT